MSEHRPPKLRPLPPEVVAEVADIVRGTPDGELLERLETALADLPETERHAVVTALGYAEGVEAVAQELELSEQEAQTLVASAVQLLRGALADVSLDEREVFPAVTRDQGVAKRRPAGG